MLVDIPRLDHPWSANGVTQIVSLLVLMRFTIFELLEGEQPLIFTGGWWPSQPNFSPEGDVLRQRAIQLGISDTSVISTRKVRNTAEEAIEVASLLPPESTVLLVTSAFHMPRALQLFNRQGVSVLPFPVDFQSTGVWAGNLGFHLFTTFLQPMHSIIVVVLYEKQLDELFIVRGKYFR